ncbi:MAG: hypothetical protein K9M44_03480 [Candidatus Pacebacteria bacterium]|nr:hypothetical protein [Candidatus Paceibacterota bacterium]
MNVLKFLNEEEIKNIFDADSILVIEYLLRKVLFSQPELLPKQTQHNIQITKEFLEQWVAQGLDWEMVGSGNYPIDVYSKKLKIGADVKFVSASVDSLNNFISGSSNETSLGQNFKDAGSELDQYFARKDFEGILKGWKDILTKKIKKPINDYDLTSIYYFIFIRGGSSINLAVAQVNINMIKNIKVIKTSDTSAFIEGFIENKYGNVKIYKSKKRMELRCVAKNIQGDNMLLKWDFKSLITDTGVDLRKLVKDKKRFNIHVKKQIDNFLNF